MPSELDPARLPDLRRLLAEVGARPKKSFGQSFLVDPELRDRVVEASGVAPGDDVLEVGAGLGTLSLRLAERSRSLVAVEVDRALARGLRRLLDPYANARVLEQDVLELDLGQLYPKGGEVVAGNIPYYLSGALLRMLLDSAPRPRRLSLVVQREVARRWTGEGGWSLATVAAHVHTVPEIAMELPATAFWPEPQVVSSLIVMEVRPEPLVRAAELAPYFRLVEATFQFRRKQLRSSLARLFGIAGDAAAERLRDGGIEPSRRPEDLTVAEWGAVLKAFGPLS